MRSLSLRPNDSLTIPGMALSIDFRGSVSFPLSYPSYRTLTFVLMGLTSTEYTSLRWTYADSFSYHCSLGCNSCAPHLLAEQGVHRRVAIHRHRPQFHVRRCTYPLAQPPLQLHQ